MAIYDQSMQKLPTETLPEYYARLKLLRGGSLLGTSGMMDIPTPGEQRQAREQAQQAGIAQTGQEVVRPMTDAQMAAQAERESGMSESERDAMVVRDTPEAQEARRNAAVNKQIKVALGGDPGLSNLDAAGGLLGVGGTLPFGVAALGLGAAADWFDRDTAALQIGKKIGETYQNEDVREYTTEEAKRAGYALLDALPGLTPERQREELSAIGLEGLLDTPKAEEKPNYFNTLMGSLVSALVPSSDTPTPVQMGLSGTTRPGLFTSTSTIQAPSLAEQLEQEVIESLMPTVELPVTAKPKAAPTVSSRNTAGAGMTTDQLQSGSYTYSPSNTVMTSSGPLMSASGPVTFGR